MRRAGSGELGSLAERGCHNCFGEWKRGPFEDGLAASREHGGILTSFAIAERSRMREELGKQRIRVAAGRRKAAGSSFVWRGNWLVSAMCAACRDASGCCWWGTSDASGAGEGRPAVCAATRPSGLWPLCTHLALLRQSSSVYCVCSGNKGVLSRKMGQYSAYTDKQSLLAACA